MTGRRLCQVLGCDEPHRARGMCSRHYRQWLRGVRAPLVGPERRYGPPAPTRGGRRRQAHSGPHRGRRSSADGPPYGWGHLPLVTDAGGQLPQGPYWDEARLDWGRYVARHIEGVFRDHQLPWWEVGLRVPWAASCAEGTPS